MKKLILILSCLCFCVPCFAMTSPAETQVHPSFVALNYCNKIFNVDNQKLFYLTLSSLTANRYTIDEMQSRSGYILFTANNMQFLANVMSIDSKHSMLRITPADSNYYFPVGIVQNCFKYIELNQSTPIDNPAVL